VTARHADAALSQQGHYAGAATRLAAFVVDQALSGALFAMGTAVVAWVVALVTHGEVQVNLPIWAIGGFYLAWILAYFAYPWAVSGKSPGMALLGIRVVRADGSPAEGRHAVLRVLTLPLSFITLGTLRAILLAATAGAARSVAGTAVVYAWTPGARWRFSPPARERHPPAAR